MAEDDQENQTEKPQAEEDSPKAAANNGASQKNIPAEESETKNSPENNESENITENNKDLSESKNNEIYWKTNLKYLGILLSIWFVVSYGFGIIFADNLDSIRIGGFKLGFWFAQQGSIFVFVILIFVYVRLMNKLDKKFTEDNN